MQDPDIQKHQELIEKLIKAGEDDRTRIAKLVEQSGELIARGRSPPSTQITKSSTPEPVTHQPSGIFSYPNLPSNMLELQDLLNGPPLEVDELRPRVQGLIGGNWEQRRTKDGYQVWYNYGYIFCMRHSIVHQITQSGLTEPPGYRFPLIREALRRSSIYLHPASAWCDEQPPPPSPDTVPTGSVPQIIDKSSKGTQQSQPAVADRSTVVDRIYIQGSYIPELYLDRADLPKGLQEDEIYRIIISQLLYDQTTDKSKDKSRLTGDLRAGLKNVIVSSRIGICYRKHTYFESTGRPLFLKRGSDEQFRMIVPSYEMYLDLMGVDTLDPQTHVCPEHKTS